MLEFSWPGLSLVPAPDVVDRSWLATVAALPLGSHGSGRVIGRRPFGVFLPAMGTTITGEVLWHADHNRQVKIRLDEWNVQG
jgi:hypothetical protein